MVTFSFPSKSRDMKQKSKVHIDTYESIYPTTLVVANNAATTKQIAKDYCWFDGVELEDSDFTNCLGCVVRAKKKSDGSKVTLVKVNFDLTKPSKPEAFLEDIATLVHEAGHVVLDTYNYVEDRICTEACKQEPFCYYLEWVFKCIYKTIIKK